MSDDKATTTSTTTPIDALAPQHATSLNTWCAEVLSLRAIAKSFDAQADDIFDTHVKPLLAQLGLSNSVAGATWTLSHNSGRSVLKPELLLQSGVPMSTIEKCKVKGKPSWSLRGKDDKTPSSSDGNTPE